MKRRLFLPSAFAFVATTAWAKTAPFALSSDATAALLEKEVNETRSSVGMVASLVDNNGHRLIARGKSDTVDGWPLDGDTVFEVGSITKIFTALILADMSLRGEVSLTDPVEKYLPAHVNVPTAHGKLVTLIDLATYVPGLPAMPPNFARTNPEDPYADYTVDLLYAAISEYPLQSEPGTKYVYSNFGYGLLGHALSQRAGLSFEDLVISRICSPLGMNSTRITLSPSLKARFAPGHDPMQRRVPNWNIPPALAGAGAFRSTANDLTLFLKACLSRKKTNLSAAFASMLNVRQATDIPSTVAGCGWFVSSNGGRETVWKDGATPGYTAFLGYDPHAQAGVVLIANSRVDLTLLGLHIVNPAYEYPPTQR